MQFFKKPQILIFSAILNAGILLNTAQAIEAKEINYKGFEVSLFQQKAKVQDPDGDVKLEDITLGLAGETTIGKSAYFHYELAGFGIGANKNDPNIGDLDSINLNLGAAYIAKINPDFNINAGVTSFVHSFGDLDDNNSFF